MRSAVATATFAIFLAATVTRLNANEPAVTARHAPVPAIELTIRAVMGACAVIDFSVVSANIFLATLTVTSPTGPATSPAAFSAI